MEEDSESECETEYETSSIPDFHSSNAQNVDKSHIDSDLLTQDARSQENGTSSNRYPKAADQAEAYQEDMQDILSRLQSEQIALPADRFLENNAEIWRFAYTLGLSTAKTATERCFFSQSPYIFFHTNSKFVMLSMTNYKSQRGIWRGFGLKGNFEMNLVLNY